MLLTDTHCHLYSEDFDADRSAVISRAREKGVGRIFLPNIDLASVAGMERLAEQDPAMFFPCMGLHPCSVTPDYKKTLAAMEKMLSLGHYRAIGETGIDLYWDKTYFREQEDSFRTQLQWARDLQLPVIIHVRNSFEETLKIVEEENSPALRGIFHCFTGTAGHASKIRSFGGFSLGVGGVLTFKNSGMEDVLNDVPIEELVLETDAPYLAPVPFRGKRNEPGHISLVAQKLAEIKGLTLDEVARITTENSRKIFNC